MPPGAHSGIAIVITVRVGSSILCRLSLVETEAVRLRVTLHPAHKTIPLVVASHKDLALDNARLPVGESGGYFCALQCSLVILEVHACRLAKRFGASLESWACFFMHSGKVAIHLS